MSAAGDTYAVGFINDKLESESKKRKQPIKNSRIGSTGIRPHVHLPPTTSTDVPKLSLNTGMSGVEMTG
jgi:hypothetical protein